MRGLVRETASMPTLIGANLSLLPAADPAQFSSFVTACHGWCRCWRVGAHADANFWFVDVNRNKFQDAVLINDAAKSNKILLDVIVDDYPPVGAAFGGGSNHWRALGGDWSSFDAPGSNWRTYQTPKEAWPALDANMKKFVSLLKVGFRAQGPNEVFARGKDQWAYARCANLLWRYVRPMTTPALWGRTEQLRLMVEEFQVMRKYDARFGKFTDTNITVYPDNLSNYDDSVVQQMLDKVGMVTDLVKGGPITVSEFGVPAWADTAAEQARRVELLGEFARRLPEEYPNVTRAFLYCAGENRLPLEHVKAFGSTLLG